MRDALIARFGFSQDDVRSTSMGAAGVDILLSSAAYKEFPFRVECKNVERLNVWEAWDQAVKNAEDDQPLLIIKRNRSKPLAVVDAETFMNVVHAYQLARNHNVP